jgi:hypothetical protein
MTFHIYCFPSNDSLLGYTLRDTHTAPAPLLVYPLKLFRIILLAYIYINSYGKLGLLIAVLNNNLWEPLRAIFMFKMLELRPSVIQPVASRYTDYSCEV